MLKQGGTTQPPSKDASKVSPASQDLVGDPKRDRGGILQQSYPIILYIDVQYNSSLGTLDMRIQVLVLTRNLSRNIILELV